MIPAASPLFVMPGLAPGIHVFLAGSEEDVDGRDKPGHDAEWEFFQTTLKIASASTACARNPTVKASVRNTGSPSV